MNKCFYVRVTDVTNQQSLGLVGMSDDLTHFLARIRSVFPESEYQIDDAHMFAPLEVYCVHPECKGYLEDSAKYNTVSLTKPILL